MIAEITSSFKVGNILENMLNYCPKFQHCRNFQTQSSSSMRFITLFCILFPLKKMIRLS